MTAQPGSILAHYRLERLIDDTGRSQVWVARHEELDRSVALKMRTYASAHEAQEEERAFVQQARLIARIEHPGIIPIFDAGVDGSTAYMAMRYIHGRSLAQWLRTNRANIDATGFYLLEPIASALDHAHRLGVAHGALAAEGMMVDEAQTPCRAMLLPFAGSAGAESIQDSFNRDAEADRIAFGQIMRNVFGDAVDVDKIAHHATCLDALRAALPAAIASGAPTPTVVRSRRTQSGRRRVLLRLSGAFSLVLVLVAGATLLLDGLDQLRPAQKSGATPAAIEQSNSKAAGATATPARSANHVLILGNSFASDVGNWSKNNRTASWRLKSPSTAADVVRTALLTIPATLDAQIVLEPLNFPNPVQCTETIKNQLDKQTYTAIVVLDSPCGDSVLKVFGTREKTLPPVYWLESGTKTKSYILPMAAAPIANAVAAKGKEAVARLQAQSGDWTGTAIARVPTMGTYSDIGRIAKRNLNINAPCFYLADNGLNPEDTNSEYQTMQDLRISHSIFEIAYGFESAPADVPWRAIWMPHDQRGGFHLPKNVSVLGSRRADMDLVREIRASGAPCIVPEIQAYETHLEWWARLLALLAQELPELQIIAQLAPNEPFEPGEQPLTPTQREAWKRILETPRFTTYESTPYTPPQSPLAGHLWDVVDAHFRKLNYDRKGWWNSEYYALVLVAELIARQPIDPSTGKPGFGKIPDGDWAAEETDFLYESAPVVLDPKERIYGGYSVWIYKNGKLHDAMYGGYAG